MRNGEQIDKDGNRSSWKPLVILENALKMYQNLNANRLPQLSFPIPTPIRVENQLGKSNLMSALETIVNHEKIQE